jgi:adenosylcobinamide-GDP ribazoletransferase
MTILPFSRERRLTNADFGRMPAWFPLAGLVLGLILFLVVLFLDFLKAPASVTAVITTLVLVIFTRGFHLDGLADSMDALFSHRSREEKLAIMKDPHQGTFGVLAIVLDVLLKSALLQAIIQEPGWQAPVILFPVWGRLASTTVCAFSRYARASGGLAYGTVEFSTFREFLTGFGFTLIASLIFGVPAFITALAAFVISILFVWIWEKALSGVTGDLLGASSETTEILCLMVYALAF